ncbi:MAG TPA: alpha/beta fold hydrolase [Methanospirillum sp.]|nr:alpha/beta fold hydrolase [Methanospirillum sp.]
MKPLSWLNKAEYPFQSHIFPTPQGDMHYVDEGCGDPIVFVHGNPSWSFQFRNLIKLLSKNYRCIAPDLIGFGLSDKPADWSYLPRDHADILEKFLDSLDLHSITLVVGDWGGPIGLSYALNHPDKISLLVITNTWLWSVRNDWHYQIFSKFVGGVIGGWLIKKRNFFARDIVQAAFGDKRKLTSEIHNHYLAPLANPDERKGTWIFPREIIGSSDWLHSLWTQADILSTKNILIAWGMKDMAFRERELNRWIQRYPNAQVIRYPDAGHFVTEEKASEVAGEIYQILHRQTMSEDSHSR